MQVIVRRNDGKMKEFQVVEDNRFREHAVYAVVKRILDIILAIISMAICAVPCLIIMLLIKKEDKGKVIFRQERIGYKGKRFIIYKFRSMVPDAEKDDLPLLCSEDDERMTKIGRFLRDHHVDELPQLWNVLKGDMSFVGPRPERQCFIDEIMKRNPDYRYLYSLRPGLFSEATLYNGYTDTMEKMLIRLDMDLDYLSRQSFLLDVKIIAVTGWSLVSGKKI